MQTPAAPAVPVRLALYQPDIPQNAGTILRTAACLGIAVDIIGPAGFDMTDRALRRAGLDYLEHAAVTRHQDWATFLAATQAANRRIALLSTQATTSYLEHVFEVDDVILLGRESAGVPQHVHAAADVRLCIPMRPGLRSLNIAVAAAMVVGEALRHRSLAQSQ